MWARSRSHSPTGRNLRRARIGVGCIALVAIAGLLVSLYLGRFFEIHRLRQEAVTLLEQERAALASQEALRDQLALKDDPETLEEKARELLGLVKPNEEKVIFIKGD